MGRFSKFCNANLLRPLIFGMIELLDQKYEIRHENDKNFENRPMITTVVP